MKCDFKETNGQRDEKGRRTVACICGRTLRTASELPNIHARCKLAPPLPPKPPGLGDYVHYWLTRWGIYYGPITWLKIRLRKHAPIDTGCVPCEARQETLNKAGWWVSSRLRAAVGTFLESLRGRLL